LFFAALVVGLGIVSFFAIERAERRLNAQFFFLGAGFLLIETRSVTEVALLFGSTWMVNAFAFAAILLAVLAANALVSRIHFRPPIGLLYAAIVAALVAGAFMPPGALYFPSLALRIVVAAVVLFSPLLLAGIVFSTQFEGAAFPSQLFGSNLLGAMFGGALEYVSLIVGLPTLYLVAALLYLLAFAARARARV
jgi:hypothetical protein